MSVVLPPVNPRAVTCPVCGDSGLRLAREPGGKLIVLGDCPACMPGPRRAPRGPAVDGSGLFYRTPEDTRKEPDEHLQAESRRQL